MPPTYSDVPLPVMATGDSPTSVSTPYWLDACLIFMPPLAERTGKPRDGSPVLRAARILLGDRIRARDEDHPVLDREIVARFSGHTTAKNARWIFQYLEQVGFLTIQKHYGSGGRRSHDTFDCSEQPPLNYVGPRTHAEVVHALRHPESAPEDLFVSPEAI